MGKLVTDQIEKTGAGALSFVVNHAERMSLSDSTGLTVTGNAIVGGHLESRGGGGLVYNTSVGFEALKSNTTGQYNTAVGWNALKSGTTGSNNVAIGDGALKSNTTGYENAAVGGVALYDNTTGYRNAAVGMASMKYNTTGNFNTAMGYAALIFNTRGTQNCAFGHNAMERNSLGNFNTAVGSSALYFAGDTFAGAPGTDAHSNTSIGYLSLYGLVTGHSNTAVGTRAGYSCIAGCTNSTFIGNDAGLLVSGTWPSNVIILGNSSIATLYCAKTSITSLSDRRDKTNIVDIPVGLEFVRSLRPVSFDWNMRCGGKVGTPEFGFIAQDLQEVQNAHTVVPGLVDESNPDRLCAAPGLLLPVLVKAIQELDKKLQELDKKLQEHIA